MAIISHSYGFLFLMTPRTACTATGKLLCEQLGGEWIPKEDFTNPVSDVRVPKKHSTLNQLIENNFLTTEEVKNLFKFTTVRNPFDSLVSLYTKMRTTYQPLLSDPESWVFKVPGYVENMKFCKNYSFEEWIIKQYKPSRVGKLLGRGQTNLYNKFTTGADYIMRFESLQDDFRHVLKKLEAPPEIAIPVFNKTKERECSYRDYYTPRSRKIVEYAFHQELETFDYKF